MPKPKTLVPIECPTCGATFSPRTSSQKYCSHACSKQPSSEKHLRTCAHCSKEFEVPFASTKRTYCSVECKVAASTVDKTGVCAVCGKPFTRDHGKNKRKYCSIACSNVARPGSTRSTKTTRRKTANAAN